MSGKEADPKTKSSGALSRLFYAALVVAAIVSIVRSVGPQTVGEQIRRHLEQQFRNHYDGYEVSIARGRYEPSIGLIFEDVRIADPSVTETSRSWMVSSKSARELVHIEKLVIYADTKAERLLEKNSPLITRRIVVHGLHANAWLNPDGKLSLQNLWPLPKFGPESPRTEIHDATIQFSSLDSDAAPLECNLSEVLMVNNPPELRGRSGGVKKSISVQGRANFAKSIQTLVQIKEDGFELGGLIKGLRVDDDLLDRFPSELQASLAQVRGIQCAADIALGVRQVPGGELDYRVKTTVHSGRYDHPKLPGPVSEMAALISCDPSGVQIESARAVCSGAEFKLNGSIANYGWPENANLNVAVNGLQLDQRLAKSIPETMKRGWDRLQPKGRVNIADGNIQYRDGKWITSGVVECKGVDVRYAKFPYPVEQLVGRVHFAHNIAATDQIGLSGRIGGRLVRCAFRLPTKPDVTHEKVFVVSTEGPVAIDRTLISSLSPRGEPSTGLERFVRSLQPRGTVFLEKATLTTDATGKVSRTIDLAIADGHLRYDKFAYPLYNVSGKIRVEDDVVTLSNFHGQNANAANVKCSGWYRMPPKNPPLNSSGLPSRESGMSLKFVANDIPMDDSLRASLPSSTQSAWDAVSPSGVVDQLVVNVKQNGRQPLELRIQGVESESSLDNRTLSIQPSALPYRLDITDGVVRYENGHVAIDAVHARHGATRLAVDGRCRPTKQGRWQLLLDVHSGSRIAPDSDLVAALPDQLRKAMYQLQLRRPVSMRGKANFLLPSDEQQIPVVDWDLVLQLEGNRLGDVGPVHSLRGEMLVRGISDEHSVRADGEIRIDSMHVQNIQMTGIRGPYSVRGDRLQLGSVRATGGNSGTSGDAGTGGNANGVRPASFIAEPSQQPLRGKLFGGIAELSGQVQLSSAAFDVDMTLQDGKVPTVLGELGHGRNALTGVVNGHAELEGILGTTDLMRGTGAARVSDANMYQLPFLVQLLNVLRITPTEDVAFTDVDVDFTVNEDAISFDDLKLWGDLVALQGAGTLDRRHELDLTFNTRVSPQNAFSRVLRPLRSKRYTLLSIDVRGQLADPVIEPRALDTFGQTLERLLPIHGSPR